MTQDELNERLITLIQKLSEQDQKMLDILGTMVKHIKDLADAQLELLKKSR